MRPDALAESLPTMLDLPGTLVRVGGDIELLKTIASLFLEEYPRQMNVLRAAFEAGDAKTLEYAAHELKGSVANFGASQAVEAAFEIEQLGRSGTLTGIAAALNRLDAAVQSLTQEFQQL